MAARPTSPAAASRPSLAEVGDAVRDATAARPGAIVTVACPGGAVHLVTDAIRAALAAARTPHRLVTVGRTGRIGDVRPPDAGEVLVVGEVQFAVGPALDALAELAEPGIDGGAVVMVHRTGATNGPLAIAHLGARRANAAFTLSRSTGSELRAATKVNAAEAERRIAITAGRADLLAALELDGSLVPDVTARLSVVAPPDRRVAELLAFGLPVDRLAALTDDADDAVDRLVVEGVLDPPDSATGSSTTPSLLAGVAEAVRSITTGARRAEVIELLGRDDSGVLITDLAAQLRATADRSAAAGAVYRRAADELAGVDPVAALGWVDDARAAGVGAADLALAEAVAAVGAGKPNRALAVLHEVPAEAVDRADAALVRAAAWVALGDLEAAAVSLDASHLRPLARWARIGAGVPTDTSTNTGDTESFGSTGSTADAAAASDAATTLGEAVATWVAGDRDGCVDAVRRAVLRHRAEWGAHRWPATADLVGALLCAQLDDLERAERVVLDAIGERRGGRGHHRRHLLTSAWLAATRGRLDDAAGVLGEVAADELAPHEALWRAGVACSIAVRDPELDALAPSAATALTVASGSGTHLYDLGIVTDIAAAAARAGMARTDELLAPAERAVARLGDPPALVADLAWARLRVALCCDDPDAIAACARALAELPAPAHHGLRQQVAAALVAIGAASTASTVPPVEAAAIEQLSQRLADVGLPHEAARLCGFAAVHTPSESDARRLLKHSRLFRAQRAQLKRAARVDRDVVRLSEQETRVAQLVLEGRTHREIGATLFISAKTVEHHVAHIRTKLSAGSRAEMLAAIRAYLELASSPS